MGQGLGLTGGAGQLAQRFQLRAGRLPGGVHQFGKHVFDGCHVGRHLRIQTEVGIGVIPEHIGFLFAQGEDAVDQA